MTKAFFAGSFDPITNGHLSLITSALGMYDHLMIGIGMHHGKAGFLDHDVREDMISKALLSAGFDNSHYTIMRFDGLLVDAARDVDAKVIVRGLRSPSDFDYEIAMVDMNRTMAPDIETVFLTAPSDCRNISSSLVRQILQMGGDISPFVPDVILEDLHKAVT